MIVGPSRLLHLLRERPLNDEQATARAITMLESLDSINVRMSDAMYLLELASSRTLTVEEFARCIKGAHSLVQNAFIGEAKLPAEVEEFLALMKTRAILHDAMNGTKK